MPNFRGNKDLCKLGKEYSNDLLCKFGTFCLQHSKTLTYNTPLYWQPSLSYQRSNRFGFFGPPCTVPQNTMQNFVEFAPTMTIFGLY